MRGGAERLLGALVCVGLLLLWSPSSRADSGWTLYEQTHGLDWYYQISVNQTCLNLRVHNRHNAVVEVKFTKELHLDDGTVKDVGGGTFSGWLRLQPGQIAVGKPLAGDTALSACVFEGRTIKTFRIVISGFVNVTERDKAKAAEQKRKEEERRHAEEEHRRRQEEAKRRAEEEARRRAEEENNRLEAQRQREREQEEARRRADAEDEERESKHRNDVRNRADRQRRREETERKMAARRERQKAFVDRQIEMYEADRERVAAADSIGAEIAGASAGISIPGRRRYSLAFSPFYGFATVVADAGGQRAEADGSLFGIGLGVHRHFWFTGRGRWKGQPGLRVGVDVSAAQLQGGHDEGKARWGEVRPQVCLWGPSFGQFTLGVVGAATVHLLDLDLVGTENPALHLTAKSGLLAAGGGLVLGMGVANREITMTMTGLYQRFLPVGSGERRQTSAYSAELAAQVMAFAVRVRAGRFPEGFLIRVESAKYLMISFGVDFSL